MKIQIYVLCFLLLKLPFLQARYTLKQLVPDNNFVNHVFTKGSEVPLKYLALFVDDYATYSQGGQATRMYTLMNQGGPGYLQSVQNFDLENYLTSLSAKDWHNGMYFVPYYVAKSDSNIVRDITSINSQNPALLRVAIFDYAGVLQKDEQISADDVSSKEAGLTDAVNFPVYGMQAWMGAGAGAQNSKGFLTSQKLPGKGDPHKGLFITTNTITPSGQTVEGPSLFPVQKIEKNIDSKISSTLLTKDELLESLQVGLSFGSKHVVIPFPLQLSDGSVGQLHTINQMLKSGNSVDIAIDLISKQGSSYGVKMQVISDDETVDKVKPITISEVKTINEESVPTSIKPTAQYISYKTKNMKLPVIVKTKHHKFAVHEGTILSGI